MTWFRPEFPKQRPKDPQGSLKALFKRLKEPSPKHGMVYVGRITFPVQSMKTNEPAAKPSQL